MSRPHDGQRPFFPFGNPFRLIIRKGSYLSPELLTLMNSFEENTAERLMKLKQNHETYGLSFSWMRLAMESVCETHVDVKTLITDLQFPVSDWDEKWVDMYLDNSVKLLDICIAFSSELSRLNQGLLLLQYIAHVLDFSKGFPSAEQLVQAHSALHDWLHQISSRNPKLQNLLNSLRGLSVSHVEDKVKNSPKGKVLVRALYGVKIKTLFVCRVFTAAFFGSANNLEDLPMSGKFLWIDPLNELQAYVNEEIKTLFSSGSTTVFKEFVKVQDHVKHLYSATAGTIPVEIEVLQKGVSAMAESAKALAQGTDTLSELVESFFEIVLTGRDALLCNLRVSDLLEESNSEEQQVMT
ncbi:protein BPS1, chloroplastic [Aristolochia californica]|uniref:protein BPS1, chloroplastic n=1 Tax=Aristolochia californica TaxID=171875 RepID=UPI0035DB887F